MHIPPIFPTALKRIIVIDLETSGLDPQAGGILQIGAIPLDPGSTEKFERHVRHEWHMPWDEGAAKVHGLTRGEAGDPRRYTDTVAVDELLDWLDDTALGDLGGRAIIAGVSPRFDRDFLRAVAITGDMVDRFDGIISHRTFDLHTLAAAVFAFTAGIAIGELRNGLDGLCTDAIYDILGAGPEAKPHVALEGARRERMALLDLLALMHRSLQESKF